MMKAPTRLATSVPSGSAGMIGFSAMPSSQRAIAPTNAPKPTAKNEAKFMRLLDRWSDRNEKPVLDDDTCASHFRELVRHHQPCGGSRRNAISWIAKVC